MMQRHYLGEQFWCGNAILILFVALQQATLLLNLAAEALKTSPHRFSFRGLAPLTLPCELQLHSEGAENSGTVWCQDQTGLRSFTAEYATV
ncbi:MAG: hypothetical protein KKG78_15835 [Alphaproteobacteria bacterium]|nr:hypothetical protein [Alphaproteobacteria bacterium]